MKSIDSFPSHSIDSKTEKSPWDNTPDENDYNYKRRRPLDFPESWKKLDFPYEVREELPVKNVNQEAEEKQINASDLLPFPSPLDPDLQEAIRQAENQADEDDLLLDPDSRRYTKLTGRANLDTVSFPRLSKEASEAQGNAETQKDETELYRGIQDFLEMMEQDIQRLQNSDPDGNPNSNPDV